MRLLPLISWPYVQKHRMRCVLTIAGIVLGVAVFVGMHSANQSVLTAFHETIDRIAGTTQLQITAGETGFSENILETVQNLPEIRAAAPVIEATVSTGHDNLLILGVDMLGDQSLRSYDLETTDAAIDDPLVFLAQPDSLLITRTFADKNGLRMNSKVPMATMQGERVFTVRGVMKPGGLASAFGGNLAIMDVYAAQKFFGRGRKFDRIDVALKDDVNLKDGAGKLRAAVGPGFDIAPPGSRGQQFEQTLTIYSQASNVTSIFALFIGMFIIYNTFATAVTQRRTEIGILRALGATQMQIRALFLVESAAAGLIGSIVGVIFGLWLARSISGYIGGLLTEVYGLAQRSGDIALDPRIIGAAVVLGILTSLAAALIPSQVAASIDPVKALQKGSYQSLTEGENRTRRYWAIGCALAALLATGFSRYAPVFYAGYLLTVMAAVLLTPALTLWLARGLRPALAWIKPVEGTLAADSLAQSPRRTSGTVAALMLSLALVISLGGLTRSSYDALSEWMRVTLSPDLFITAAQSLSERTFLFPNSLTDGLRAIPGIQAVQPVRSVQMKVNNFPVLLIALDPSALRERLTLPAVQGDPAKMYELTARGQGALVSEVYAGLHGGHLGQILEVPAPGGSLRVPIIGIVRDFSNQQGSVMISRDLFINTWHDDGINLFRIYLQPNAVESDVRERILAAYGKQQRLFVLTNQEVRRYITRITDQWFGLTYIQVAVAVLVAILGIVNTLSVSIMDRRREFGILQAVGGLRGQIRRTVWMEACAIGIIGVVLGLSLGAVQLYYGVKMMRPDTVGMNLAYTYPFSTALFLIPGILVVAFCASLGPAETAVRGSLLGALEYE